VGRSPDLSAQSIQLIFNLLWIRQAHHERIFDLSLPQTLVPSCQNEIPINQDFNHIRLSSHPEVTA
jgi:hypothetical protein